LLYDCLGPCVYCCTIVVCVHFVFRDSLHLGPLSTFVVMQKEVAKRSGHQVSAGGTANLYYVQSINTAEGKEYEVDFTNNLASVKCCEYVTIHQLPCRHCIPVFYKRRMLNSKRKARATIAAFWPKWAQAEVYRDMYTNKTVRRPDIYAGKCVGPEEDKRLPPVQAQKKRGRPKKERYRFKPKTVQSVKDRMPTVYHAYYQEVMQFV